MIRCCLFAGVPMPDTLLRFAISALFRYADTFERYASCDAAGA